MKCFQAFIFFSVLMISNVHASPSPDENEILQALANMSPRERQALLYKAKENDSKAQKERLISKIADLGVDDLKALQGYIPERIKDVCSHHWKKYTYNEWGCDGEYNECDICGKRE